MTLEITPSKASRYKVPVGLHWHRPDRTKACIRCGEEKSLGEFYSYEYTTAQGKRSTRYESRCRPCSRERRMETYQEKTERDRATSQAWKERNRDRLSEYTRSRQSDPEYRAMKARAQRMREARAKATYAENTPGIAAIYAEASRIEKVIALCPVFDLRELGKKMHVDHIKPLSKGGEHIVSNLQILPAGINMRKGVKWS